MHRRIIGIFPLVIGIPLLGAWWLHAESQTADAHRAAFKHLTEHAEKLEAEIGMEILHLRYGGQWNFHRLTRLSRDLVSTIDDLMGFSESELSDAWPEVEDVLGQITKDIEEFKTELSVERTSRSYLHNLIESLIRDSRLYTDPSLLVDLLGLQNLLVIDASSKSNTTAIGGLIDSTAKHLTALGYPEAPGVIESLDRHSQLVVGSQRDIDEHLAHFFEFEATLQARLRQIAAQMAETAETKAKSYKTGAAFFIGICLIMAVVISVLMTRLSAEIKHRGKHNRLLEKLVARRTGQLEKATEEAVLANKHKSRFLATMSHEIRTPLNGVMGFADILLHDEISAEQRKNVQIIKDCGDNLLAILDDILDLAKVESGKVTLEPLDFSVHGLMESANALWQTRAEAKGLTFKMTLDLAERDTVRADMTRLRQIVFNLISNAIKFTERGDISVSASWVEGQDSQLLFRVSDTGIGVTEAQRSMLFQAFEQADNSTTRKYGGTGLGLAISKQLVELMGGEIGIDSISGGGSTFWFTIAVEPAEAEIAPTRQGPDDAASLLVSDGRCLRILAAEDNRINQLVLKKTLQAADCELDVVANGVEAVEAIQSKPYDIVLMDIQMPEMDGLAATRAIRALPGAVSAVPIVALTANAMQGDREKYLAAEMTDYVAKPIKVEELFAAIRRCCDGHALDSQVA